MYNGKKVIVVLPAYNAAKTLEKTYLEIPFDLVDEVVLVDDHSRDDTMKVFATNKIKGMVATKKPATKKP
jgi:glycosyltransferase involved in cell wall biosynthesis